MPPIPDLGTLKLAAADSQRVALCDADAAKKWPDATKKPVTPPVLLTQPALAWPPAAERHRLQGWVALMYLVGPDGVAQPGCMAVLGASDPVFVDAARYQIQGTVFRPARWNGTPVPAWASQVVAFKFPRGF
jgi:hypothetical protein